MASMVKNSEQYPTALTICPTDTRAIRDQSGSSIGPGLASFATIKIIVAGYSSYH